MLCLLKNINFIKYSLNMSRIGKTSISIPNEVNLILKKNYLSVKGPLGKLLQEINKNIKIIISGNKLSVERISNQKKNKSLHGLYRALINNMILGVTKGFVKKLELVGIGYRVSNIGKLLELNLGFSHNIIIEMPDEIEIKTISEKGKNPLIILTSYNKELLGIISAKIRSLRKPEPYKGKGVKYLEEIIQRKTGKSA